MVRAMDHGISGNPRRQQRRAKNSIKRGLREDEEQTRTSKEEHNPEGTKMEVKNGIAYTSVACETNIRVTLSTTAARIRL